MASHTKDKIQRLLCGAAGLIKGNKDTLSSSCTPGPELDPLGRHLILSPSPWDGWALPLFSFHGYIYCYSVSKPWCRDMNVRLFDSVSIFFIQHTQSLAFVYYHQEFSRIPNLDSLISNRMIPAFSPHHTMFNLEGHCTDGRHWDHQQVKGSAQWNGGIWLKSWKSSIRPKSATCTGQSADKSHLIWNVALLTISF